MRVFRMVAVLGALGLAGGFWAGPQPAAQAASVLTLYAAPSGSGAACSPGRPCSLPGAQQAVRRLLADGHAGRRDGGISVLVEGGTYRLAAPLRFGPRDSGTPADPVRWQAAPGARPVLSGGTRVTGWDRDGCRERHLVGGGTEGH